MLFCDRLSDDEWVNARSERRLKLVQEIVKDLALSFMPISFRLELKFNLINAQAVTTASGRHVNIYGGLALHPKLGHDSVVLVALHEVGHHLSNACRSPYNVTLACECAADRWSVTEGANVLWQRSGRSFSLDNALEELSRIMPCDPDSFDETERLSSCWSYGWFARKRALLDRSPVSLFGCHHKEPSWVHT